MIKYRFFINAFISILICNSIYNFFPQTNVMFFASIICPVIIIAPLALLSMHSMRCHREREAELEAENLALRAELIEANELQGLLPICAACKKIRDDKGRWHQVEEYIIDHSHARFTHGVCPQCATEARLLVEA